MSTNASPATYCTVRVNGAHYRVTEGGGVYDDADHHYGWIDLFPYYDSRRPRRELTSEVRRMVTSAGRR